MADQRDNGGRGDSGRHTHDDDGDGGYREILIFLRWVLSENARTARAIALLVAAAWATTYGGDQLWEAVGRQLPATRPFAETMGQNAYITGGVLLFTAAGLALRLAGRRRSAKRRALRDKEDPR